MAATPRPAGLTDDEIKRWSAALKNGDTSVQNDWNKNHPQWLEWINNPKNAAIVAEKGTVPAAAMDHQDAVPVAGLNGTYDPSGSKRYPEDIGAEASDYMIFDFYDYVAPFSNAEFGGTSLKAYNASNTNLQKATNFNQIVLYMPEGVSVSYKANWDGKKFGNVAAGILSASGGFAGGNLKSFFEKLGKTAGEGVERAGAQIGANAISSIISGITGDSVTAQDIFSSVGGQILNPNAELIFGGHDLRTFTFTYRLVPFNAKEAAIIFDKNDGIISTFKKAMLPSFGGISLPSGSSELTNVEVGKGKNIGFIQNPKLVQPHFMSGNTNHKFLPRLKPCTITDFDVNYTADGVYAAHVDGYPAAAEISISLIETKLIYAEDIGVGY